MKIFATGDTLAYKYVPKVDLKMKLTTILLIISLFKIQANSYSQNTRMDIDLRDVPIIEVLKEIEKKTEFSFFYEKGVLDLKKIVSIEAENETIADILKKLLKGSNVYYEIVDQQIMLKVDKPSLTPEAPRKTKNQTWLYPESLRMRIMCHFQESI